MSVKTKVILSAVLVIMVVSAIISWRRSNEILDSFQKTNQSLESATQSQKSPDDSLAEVLRSMEHDTVVNRVIVRLKKECNSQVDYIEFLKAEILKRAGGPDSIMENDNIDVSTKYMVDEHQADTLLVRSMRFKEFLMSVCADDKSRNEIERNFNWVQSKYTGGAWGKHWFYHVPVSAALTILNRAKNDCVNCEGIVLEGILKKSH